MSISSLLPWDPQPIPPPYTQPNLPAFKYDKIIVTATTRQIRLLRIFPKSPPAVTRGYTNIFHQPSQAPVPSLTVELIPVALQEGILEFSALSYCWGDANDKVTIVCNQGLLQITRSLYVALEAFRDGASGRPQYVWADGICINQQDECEQETQIPLMTELYNRAAQVVVWLGDAQLVTPNGGEQQIQSEIQHAVLGIQKFANALLTRPNTSAMTMSMGDWLALGFRSPEEVKHQIRAFYRLMERPWFKRVWTIQEHAVAKSLVFCCGNFSIEEHQLMNANAWLESTSAAQGIANWGLSPLILQHRIKTEQQARIKPPLLYLLANFRHRHATKAKDKVYSLYNLACDANELDIVIKAAMPVERCFTDLAVSFLYRDHNLDILSFAGTYTKAVPPETPYTKVEPHAVVPSWVPDWSFADSTVSIQYLEARRAGQQSLTSTPPAQYMFRSNAEPTHFKACGNTAYFPQFTLDGGLVVRGTIVDSIRRLGQVNNQYREAPTNWQAEESLDSQMDQVFRICSLVSDWLNTIGAETTPPRVYFTGEPMLDVFWQTMRCGHFPHGFAQEREAFMQWYTATQPTMSIWRIFGSQTSLRNSVAKIYNTCVAVTGGFGVSQNFFTRTAVHTGNRAMFISHSGLVGLAPNGSLDSHSGGHGDQIAVFEGGNVPFVVRRKDANWQIVGACYVHGYMHGHLFNSHNSITMTLI